MTVEPTPVDTDELRDRVGSGPFVPGSIWAMVLAAADEIDQLRSISSACETERENLVAVINQHDEIRADLMRQQNADRLREWQTASVEIASLRARIDRLRAAALPDTTDELFDIHMRICDPGAFLPRGDNYSESITHWSARAVVAYLESRRVEAALTGNETTVNSSKCTAISCLRSESSTEELLEAAWGLIANAMVREADYSDWMEAAKRWRVGYITDGVSVPATPTEEKP